MASGQASGSSSSSRPPPTTSLNPVSGVLANLFGIPTSIQEGGIMYGGRGASFPYASPVFGAGSGFERVGDFMNLGSPFSQYLQTPEALDLIASGMGTYENAVLPAFQDLAATGSPVDVGPLVDQSIYEVAESLGPVTGLYSSDITNEALRQAAQLGVSAQEAAKQRQLAALLGAGEVLSGPASWGQNLLSLGEEMNLATTPSGRAVAMLQLLAGLQPTGAIPRGNISSSSSDTAGGGIFYKPSGE